MKHIKPLPTLSEKDLFNFKSKLDKASSSQGCWLWTGSKSRKGYGILSIGKRTIFAHRISFHLAGGITSPDKPLVCHGPCHNPSCVNPDHLEAGSSKKNTNDQIRDKTKLLGETTNSAKLNPKKVIEIRKRFSQGNVSAPMLANEYKVSQAAILNVVHQKTWKHVKTDEPISLPNAFYTPSRKGVDNASAKINETMVREIRKLRWEKWILKDLAAKFGLSTTNIHDIVTGKVWPHVDPHLQLPPKGQYR